MPILNNFHYTSGILVQSGKVYFEFNFELPTTYIYYYIVLSTNKWKPKTSKSQSHIFILRYVYNYAIPPKRIQGISGSQQETQSTN